MKDAYIYPMSLDELQQRKQEIEAQIDLLQRELQVCNRRISESE